MTPSRCQVVFVINFSEFWCARQFGAKRTNRSGQCRIVLSAEGDDLVTVLLNVLSKSRDQVSQATSLLIPGHGSCLV